MKKEGSKAIYDNETDKKPIDPGNLGDVGFLSIL